MFGFYFDIKYVLFVALPCLAMSGIASLLLKSAYHKYSRIGTRRGYTGAQAAKLLLEQNGIYDVQVGPTQGFLSDHYNPMSKTLALSPDVYSGNSVAAVGIACHEAGHAIQHAFSYAPLWVRSALVPVVSIGSNLSGILITMGVIMSARPLLLLGVIAFGTIVLFQFVTLPVEFDASARAKRLCVEAGIISEDEREGVSRVLNAAALTYVAAFAGSLLTLLYYLVRLGLIGGDRREE